MNDLVHELEIGIVFLEDRRGSFQNSAPNFFVLHFHLCVNINPKERTGTENHTEGKAMFEVMRRLVKNSKKRTADFQSKLPACLQEMTEKSTMQKKFPCTICGKLFPKIEQLITHSHEHGPHDNRFNECCFCGLSLGDPLRLNLHQMAHPISRNCYSCKLKFSDLNELNHHSCFKV